ncbi:hypothetical protein, partial [Dysosmobacter sp.]|uniref:hypothetical protein n=1 Tax=Dysosmobacter sp. TaxID=2591382 RepID=UPI003AF132C8
IRNSSLIFSLRAFSSGVRFFLAIIKPPLWCFYYTPPWRFTQNMGWSLTQPEPANNFAHKS